MNLAYIPSPSFSRFSIGPVTIHMYAICILTGVCVAVWILTTRWKRAGGTFDQILDTTLVTVPCALVGARLYHCITTPEAYFPPPFGHGDLVNILKVWEGGMAIFGGIIVGALVVFLWCRKHRYPFALFADCIAPALMVAQAIGRLGNWFNQELYGKPTTLPWGLKLNESVDAIGHTEVCYDGKPCPTGTLFHPTFLYEMIWNLIGAAIIVWLGHKLVNVLRNGQQFAMYLMWYGLGRTWIESIRINYSSIVFGLRVNVWTAILCFLLGCVLFVVLQRTGGTYESACADLRKVTADQLESQTMREELHDHRGDTTIGMRNAAGATGDDQTGTTSDQSDER
ncbi:prolipoprotein diacylglyceryl transferase [Bifidobacterium jacchi]|uniref:Phosphatidylglycerol--prolipoprotein diacylglyceryl transferase n=1 Tax=Bifidobacterium jacchi TaxID=2490545 RepID=A0A5N5RLX4_9BIFI|nr:prolipoprotein diacylglyceryl transferase [Bifidobacterium jacchi]KAB5608304.1 prolipoprotein diacylglyceryl transferase [Bifidobacterium jacchi]